MLHHFKQFRKRHLSNDSVLTLFPLGSCRKPADADVITPNLLLKKDEEEVRDAELGGGGGDALSQADGTKLSDGECVLRGYLMEPNEVDHPIRCPHPEHGIIQDGRALKLRAPSIKRRGQLPFLTNNEVQSMRWSRRAAPSDCQIYPTASAPETSLKIILP